MDKKRSTSKKRKFKKKSKYHKLKITLISILGILLVTMGLGIGYVYNILSKTNQVEIDTGNIGISEETENKLKDYDVTNIALFGVDSEGNYGRSDSIMIATIDNSNNELKLCSIMRDSYVDVPGHGMDKINHAYAFGGPELALRTLNTNFDLNLDKFITVNFDSLPKVIDSIGGISINITNGDLKYINGYIDDLNRKNGTSSKHIYTTGTQNLNGTQATAYARIRYDGGDQGRTDRHRTIMQAILSKGLKISPTKIPGLLDDLLPLVDTNISSTEFIGLGTDVLTLGAKELKQDRFPSDSHRKGTMINGVSYQTFNKTQMIDEIHNFIFK